MKRKFAWLALPLVLAAVMLCVKWRAEHPTPTKEDLAIRAVLSKNSAVKVSHVNWDSQIGEYKASLSKNDFQPFNQCLYISPQISAPKSIQLGEKGVVTITRDDKAAIIIAILNIDAKVGELYIPRSGEIRACLHKDLYLKGVV